MNSKKTVLTGDRPTGPLHLGHYVGSLQNRVKLQEGVGTIYDSAFYMVADVQALTDNYDNPQKVHDNVIQVIADNIAIGLDPTKTTIFIQSQIPQIAELTVFFMNLVTVNQLIQNPTIKTEIAQKGWQIDKLEVQETSRFNFLFNFGGKKISATADVVHSKGVPAGFLCYPVSQAADILFAKASVIPVGEDQKPVVEVCREIARKFNTLYKCEIFPEPQVMLSETTRLVGADGNAKMSKSLGNAIYLKDSNEEIAAKVKSMFTCPSKVRITDIVTDEELSKNVVFQYLDIFAPEQSSLIATMRQDYKEGKIGDSEGKKLLTEVLQNLITPIRERREKLLQNPEALYAIAKEGCEKARAVGQKTLDEVKQAMKIGYFN